MAKTRPIPVDLLNDEGRDLYEAINQESALPCVLISVGYIEQCLATLLHKFCIEGKTADELFDHENGVLKDLYSRAKVAYCLGLVGKELFNNLKNMGTIRNLFAHSHLAIDFSDPKVSGLCSALTLPSVLDHALFDMKTGMLESSPRPAIYADPQNRFKVVAVLSATRVVINAMSAKRCRDLYDRTPEGQ
jgi:DNA-binding MltR family transcriptional regulator